MQSLTDKPPPRLDEALSQVRASPSSSNVTFTVHFEPYQLYPDFPESTDQAQWYLENKHNGNRDAQAAYRSHMSGLFAPLGTTPRFDAPMGNTLGAHRVLQAVQDRQGADAADRLLDALYEAYFVRGRHPAADETLVEACVEAGLSREEAERLVGDRQDGERDVKDRLRSVAMDVDAVPVVVVEGRKRDVTLTGAKEVSQYVKALETIVKDSS